MGAANKVSGNKITGNKVLKKTYRKKKKPRKNVLSLVKMRSSLRRFHKKYFFLCIYIFNIAMDVFNINCPFFVWMLTSFVSIDFLLEEDFFSGTFLYEIIPEKKS